MQISNAAKQLEALGHETRLAIYHNLCKTGKEGLSVGKIKEMIDVPASTLSHHITKLVMSGLVTRSRQGRMLICAPDQAKMDALVMYLADNCCGDDSEVWA